jgi:Lrp/AsnC family leucine-responsive transcriptional regulator
MDTYDKKILYHLDRNSRMSHKEISEKIKRSKEFVFHRIQKLEKEDILFGYHSIIDRNRIFPIVLDIYFKTTRFNPTLQEELIEFLKDHKDVWATMKINGNWDYALLVQSDSLENVYSMWDSLRRHFSTYIRDYKISISTKTYNLSREFFLDSPEPKRLIRPNSIKAPIKIREVDKKLISLIETNSRISITDISNQLTISPKLARDRLKFLEKNKIIIGFKTSISFLKIGVIPYVINLTLYDFSKKERMINWLIKNKNVSLIIERFGGDDLSFVYFVKDIAHLITFIDSFKDLFSENIDNITYWSYSNVFYNHPKK